LPSNGNVIKICRAMLLMAFIEASKRFNVGKLVRSWHRR
jgi:hypothetical protein